MLADKLNLVKKNIEEACDTAGRSPQEVTLIAVSKTKPVEMLKEAYDAGARVFGENRFRRSWINTIRCHQMYSGT